MGKGYRVAGLAVASRLLLSGARLPCKACGACLVRSTGIGPGLVEVAGCCCTPVGTGTGICSFLPLFLLAFDLLNDE